MNSVRYWVNWAGNVSSQPSSYHEPTTEDEIVSLVKSIANVGERIKVVGSGHSCSRIAASNGVHLVSLVKYNKVLEIKSEACTVTVQAGISLKQINNFIEHHGLVLSNIGTISEQTIAGAISTGTHGTGINFGGISQQITALTMVCANGEVISLSKEQEPEFFAAALVSLGCLGIISTVTISCESAFNLRWLGSPATLDYALEHLEELNQSEHFAFWWFPHTNYVYLMSSNRTAQPIDPPKNAIVIWFKDVILGNYLHEVALWLSVHVPGIVPTINQCFRYLFFSSQRERIALSYQIFNLTILIRQYVMEYAIPIENTATAIRKLRDLIDEAKFKVHFPIEVRFSAKDDAWLSLSYGRETCFIGVIIYRPFGQEIPYENYFQQVDALMISLEGRPHWGKIHYQSTNHFRKLYPKWDEFLTIRNSLDPKYMFINDYLERIFFDEA
ncbi:D-arabinono-1,4-lactone oxidase [Microcoleus sp. B9-D4]|uniref:D-arabinono-1,4-lactone oxidase n=1 Tax=Microcoleus sp. B9-D4 TaxID=2818711 RepID=UPI002FD2DC04